MANHILYPGSRMVSVHVRLPERLRDVALRIGKGNMRAGIALALERAEMLENEYQKVMRKGETQ